MRKIIGLSFDDNGLFENYIYEDLPISKSSNIVFGDEELSMAVMQKLKESDIRYIGEFNTFLNIDDLNLFEKVPPKIEEVEMKEVEQIKKLTDELEELKLQMAELLALSSKKQ